MKQGKFLSYDNTKLEYYLFECENPKKVIQIAHGMQEYSKTYFEFAKYLCSCGYVVFLFDQRGHGKSVNSIEKLGKVEKDIFEQTVNDHLFVSKKLKEKYKLPIVFIGHSYGSFIGQKYLQLQDNLCEKVVLIGSSYMKTNLVKFGKLVASVQRKIFGENKDAKFIEKMSLKGYSKHFKTGSWITSDEQETKKFYSDKLNGTTFSIGFYYYMFKNQLKLYDKNNLEKVDKNIPILITSGDKDPVGNFGKGTTLLFEEYKKYKLNVELKLYKNLRHGILQEKNRHLIFENIVEFIEE